MKISESIGTMVKLAVACGVAYAIMKWQVLDPQDGDISDYAESMCVDAIRDRYDTSMVSTYAVKENTNGYTVRASVTMTNGSVTKAYCLTNDLGGVRDITIER